MKTRSLLLAAVCLLSLAGGARAASSAWFEAEGGRIRLVTAGKPDDQGRLQGALQIDLKPGWKTYWRDPGGSGVPPSIDVSANPLLAGAVIDFPAPELHSDGTSSWAGYDTPIALPVTFNMRASGSPGPIKAAVFLGICETICIPVQTTLEVDPGTETAADAALVSAARAALPAPANETLGAEFKGEDDKSALVAARLPAGTNTAELFVAGGDGYMFGTPKLRQGENNVVFSVPIITRPKEKPTGNGLHYTLVTPQGAVSGLLPYF